MKTKIPGLMAAALLLLQNQPAKADSISYTNSITGAMLTGWTLTQFNTNAGSLKSINLDLSGAFGSTFTVTNTGLNPFDSGSAVQKNVNIFLGSSALDQALNLYNPNGTGKAWVSWLSDVMDISFLASGASKSATMAGVVDSGAVTFTDNTLLNYFIGSGTTSIDFNTINGFCLNLNGGSSCNSSVTTGALSEDLTGIITYNYTAIDPVPEPTTLALAVIGALGWRRLFRRRK
jgi:hypothetical protein